MEIVYNSGNLNDVENRCLVVLATKDGKVLNGNENLTGQLAQFAATGEFGKSLGDNIMLTRPQGVKAARVLFMNLGKEVGKDDHIRRATSLAWRELHGKAYTEVAFSLDGLEGDNQIRAAVEGFILGEYQYTRYKTEADKLKSRLAKLTLHDTGNNGEKVDRWHNIAKGTLRARDLYQMPANDLYPARLADLVAEWAPDCGFKASIMNEEECKQAGMGALVSVGQGSARDSRLIIMDYTPANPSGKTICLVGKAVTFDSGGLNIKLKAMQEMKGDMGGGAAVVGIMTVLRDAGCPHRVVGLVPSVENMPSSTATRPSDVVTSLSGLTIEINNTDAEGRLILADALTYAGRYKPDFVVDFATLTGACLVGLGPKVCAVMGNNRTLIDNIVSAGKDLHELFWELPLVEEYEEFLKSDVADISNLSNCPWGGSITAGLFLKRFADDYQWAHCDIAAAILDSGDDYSPSGGNGVGVRMMLEVMDRL